MHGCDVSTALAQLHYYVVLVRANWRWLQSRIVEHHVPLGKGLKSGEVWNKCSWESSLEGDSLTRIFHWEWQCHVWSHHYPWLATWWSLSWWESMRHPIPSGGASYWPSWWGWWSLFVIRDVIRQPVLNPDGSSVKPCHFILRGLIRFHCNDWSQTGDWHDSWS